MLWGDGCDKDNDGWDCNEIIEGVRVLSEAEATSEERVSIGLGGTRLRSGLAGNRL